MNHEYVVTPFLAWFLTGTTKFVVNSFRTRTLAFDLIGYGGFPSNHSAICTSVLFLIGINEGIDSFGFGIMLAFTFIVLLDATSLRREVGKHAAALNKLSDNDFRERMGHTKIELVGGVVVGTLAAILVATFF